MLPLKDDTPRYSAPLVNTLLIVTNVVAYLLEGTLDPRAQAQFVRIFALNPARLVAGVEGFLHPAVVHGAHGVAHGVAGGAAHGMTLPMALLPVLSSMFMHASFWYHLLPNMWFLWVFGRSMEDALGHGRYLAFYLVCGVAAAAAQVLSDPTTTVPMVGASGAIAGIMGGYFVLYPRARVLMLVPFLFIFFLWLPAWAVLGYWFVIQFLSGVGTELVQNEKGMGGVAFWAHVGGFAAGFGLMSLFPARVRRYMYR